MPISRRRGATGRVAYVMVDQDGVKNEAQAVEAREPVAIVDDILQRSNTRHAARQVPSSFGIRQKDDGPATQAPSLIAAPLVASLPTPNAVTTAAVPATASPRVNSNPATTTAPVSFTPDGSYHGSGDDISQGTEHFLIAAGSIGATIIVVMIILSLYTMYKRGLTFKELFQRRDERVRARTLPPSQYPVDNKLAYEESFTYSRKNSAQSPAPAAIKSRSNSLSSPTLIKPLARSDSFGQQERERSRSNSIPRDYVITEFQRSNSTRRNSLRRHSATASSIILPIQEARRNSVSTHNTRSTMPDEHELQIIEPPSQPMAPPAPPVPPTFRQFLSNRPSISQKALNGGPMASRFSWTNSQAPQTPHEPSRDTVAAPTERDSFMTNRTSIPRFRTVDSWVNQQSNRIQEQRLKEQFRLTQSTMYSIDASGEVDDHDEVPEMPVIPKSLKESSGLVGKEIKNKRRESSKSTLTAPIFKAHPGTEVRFSTHSTVPSEVLDLDRRTDTVL